MKKYYKIIFVLGVLLVLLPLSGLPSEWDIYIASIIGLILMLGVVVYRVNIPLSNSDSADNTRTENIYIDSKGHVSREMHVDSDEEIQEVEVDLKPGQQIEIDIEEEK